MAEHEVVDPDPMAEGEVMESDPMAEGKVMESNPMAEGVVSGFDPMAEGSEVRATSSSSDLKVSLRNHQMVNQFTETLHRMLLQKGLHSLAQLLEVPDSCNPEGLLEMHNCLPIVTGQCDALLHGVVAAFSELLASPVSPGALERERDLTSLEEVVPEVRPSSKLTAPLHQGQNKQHVDTEEKTADAGNTQQEEQRHHHSTPENFGPTHNFPDHTTVFFTRLDLERNLKALRQGLVCGRLPKNTYENVAAVMESYAELQQERLSSLVKSYSSFVRSWEAVRRTSVGEPHRRPVVTKMEGLQRQRAQCWRKVNTMYSERRLQLAAVLTTTLKQVEAQSGIFLIKPVISWKRRLDSTSKIGTCRKNSIRKGRPSRLASMCSHAAVGLMGSEQILGQPLRTVSKVCSEKGWHESETRSQPLERSETTGKTCPATTPRLPEMDTRVFCVTSAKKNYGSNIQSSGSLPVQRHQSPTGCRTIGTFKTDSKL
ncbi:uncharacterized protein LOC127585162 [Pristis pectinata]|uniref:uncharacterized protein LOC127585162 n=1 Tax=Pristis pectinata TaxID=685728 RepID=UPI00223E552D|nr:uncharacterized protein LOC127585162 [Pristis pectinata]